MKGGPRLKPNKLVYIGCRDLDQAERREIRSKNILCFTMHDVDRWGIGEIVNRAINHLGPDVPLHLSYDIDAVDPEVAPSTGWFLFCFHIRLFIYVISNIFHCLN